MIVGGFNTLLSITDRQIDRRLKEIKRPNTIKQVALTDIYRSLYPKTTEDIFSSAHGIVSSIDFMLRHKLSLNRFKKIDHTKWVLKTQKNEIRNQ